MVVRRGRFGVAECATSVLVRGCIYVYLDIYRDVSISIYIYRSLCILYIYHTNGIYHAWSRVRVVLALLNALQASWYEAVYMSI